MSDHFQNHPTRPEAPGTLPSAAPPAQPGPVPGRPGPEAAGTPQADVGQDLDRLEQDTARFDLPFDASPDEQGYLDLDQLEQALAQPDPEFDPSPAAPNQGSSAATNAPRTWTHPTPETSSPSRCRDSRTPPGDDASCLLPRRRPDR